MATTTNEEVAPATAPVPATATDTSDGMNHDGEYTSAALSARELEWAVNSPDVLQIHKDFNGPIIRTRFPPEPNGFLHIGHAKSMNMNFRLAFEKLKVPVQHRRTVFRYDDTNPDAEEERYIESLRNDLQWLGWTPERTTYASDNFTKLCDLAIVLIKKGLAYVDDMTKVEMEKQRELAMKRVKARESGKDPDVECSLDSVKCSQGISILPGRNRDTSVERNLIMFDKMRMGMYEEGSHTLRLKMDFTSPNPNLYDLVAYRIKYTPHPHAGTGWCIYPSYDFTHGICDSLEDIDYSICTLEFEARREPYYWILWALDMYKPKVYEMSRLNLQYTVLSKRRLIKLVESKVVRGWDDPRMPTVSGLRRRGYTPDIINTFCNDVGATRAMNVVEKSKLNQTARVILSTTSRRVMAAIEPIKVIVTNYDTEAASQPTMTFDVQNSPTDESLGKHTITFTPAIYIDSSDFRLVDSPEYYGLALNKTVGLKYQGGNLICDEVIRDSTNPDKVIELHCHLDNSVEKVKPKTHISWVPSNSVKCEVRLYNELFTVPEPSDLWEDELNDKSEIVHTDALVDPSVKEIIDVKNIDIWKSNVAFQFERFGYFVVDYDTKYDPSTDSGNIVFNRTVSLKEEIFKKDLSTDEKAELLRRQTVAKGALAAKEERMKIDPKDLFKVGEEFVGKYSKYDEETGIPTHDIDGVELTKSAVKKLKAEQQKHIKQLMKWKK